jgi:two-component system NtrC family response regulator
MTEKIKLLIVDDELRFLETLSKRLSIRDFDVTPVTNGTEALETARKQRFDLALVDLKMPGMTGEQLLEALKSEHPDIEVVILTGHGSIGSAVQCTQAGSYSYLQKPCETEELLSVLRDAYTKRVQRRLEIDTARMEEMLNTAVGESPLAVLRRLKEMDQSGKR